MQHQLAFVDTRLLFVQRQTFVSAQKCFSCNTKILFWTSFRMLCHGHIYLLSRSNKIIIKCQKKNKTSLLCDTNFAFCALQIYYIQILHCTLAA